MITKLDQVAVVVATLTANDTVERRVEIVDTRDGSIVVSLSAAAALEVGRKVVARARLLLR